MLVAPADRVDSPIASCAALTGARVDVGRLDKAPEHKRRLLRSLVDLTRDLLVKTVAEGIETAAEARACAELGFTYGQGFHFGQARPIDEI